MRVGNVICHACRRTTVAHTADPEYVNVYMCDRCRADLACAIVPLPEARVRLSIWQRFVLTFRPPPVARRAAPAACDEWEDEPTKPREAAWARGVPMPEHPDGRLG